MLTVDDVQKALVATGNAKALEITIEVFRAIRGYISKDEGYIPLRAIENLAHVSGPTATKHIKYLEDCGAIKVTRDEKMSHHYEIGTAATVRAIIDRQKRIQTVKKRLK